MSLLDDGLNVLGSNAPPEPEPEPDEVEDEGPSGGAAGYDPGEYKIAEVKDYVETHPDEVDDVLAAEKAGKNRVTLVEWLTDHTEPAGDGAEETIEGEN